MRKSSVKGYWCYRLLGWAILLYGPIAYADFPQNMSGKKSSKKEITRDPLVTKGNWSGSGGLSSQAKAALKRSGKPGVLLAEAPQAGKIYQIIIEGAKKVEPDAVLSVLGTQVDESVERSVVANDVRKIFAMGLFDKIEVDESEGPEGSVVLTYLLKEKPIIREIKIEGNDELGEDDIKNALDLRAFHVADEPRIRENAEKIKKLYVEKGYFLAEVEGKQVVSVDEKEKEGNFVDVVFTIREQSKVKIGSIAFLGNDHISSSEIKSYMNSKQAHPLGVLTRWGTYHSELLEYDLMLIEQLYQERGFLNIQIAKPRVGISADKSRLDIHISLTEGKKYHLGNLRVSGDLVEEDEEVYKEKISNQEGVPFFLKKDLLESISLKKGDVFNKTQLGKDIAGVVEQYKDEGFAYVNVTPVPEIHDDDLSVDLNVQISSGPKVEIERVDIKGNTKTADEVIRREVRIYEGDLYSSTLLRLSEQRVSATGFFETVKLVEKPGSQPDKVVIEVEVIEKSSGQINAGIGYGMGGEGVIGKAQIAQTNLFGRGQYLALQVEWSRFRRIFDGRFVDPYVAYIADAPLLLSVAAYNTQRYMNSYSRGSTGGDVSLGYPIGQPFSFSSRKLLHNIRPEYSSYIPDLENLQFTLGYGLERVIVSDDSLDVSIFGLHINEPRYTSSIKTSLSFDQRNNRIYPSAGYYIQLGAEFASPVFGAGLLKKAENGILFKQRQEGGLDGGLAYQKPDASTNLFSRYRINLRAYYNWDSWFPLKGWVMKLNVDMGILDTFGQELIFENYAMGGLNDLRGYFYRSIGPVAKAGKKNDPTAPWTDFVLGGNKQFMLNLELEFPLLKQIGINGVLFLDTGNVFGPGENFFYIGNKYKKRAFEPVWDPIRDLPFSLYASAGLGVRWNSPFGLVRFEWGFPIFRRPVGTPGLPTGDDIVNFEFNIGTSF